MLKIKFLLLASFVVLSSLSEAQHCPFDGFSIVLLKFNDTINKTAKYTLQEIDNPNADACTYGEGLLLKGFKPIKSIYTKNKWIAEYEKRQGVSLKSIGDYYVLLSMAEADCMIKNGNDFEYKKRKFIINIENNKSKQKQIEVNSSMVYSLCTSKNKWGNIKPIIIIN